MAVAVKAYHPALRGPHGPAEGIDVRTIIEMCDARGDGGYDESRAPKLGDSLPSTGNQELLINFSGSRQGIAYKYLWGGGGYLCR